MNWDDMRIFLAVAREGSVSGAARRLDVQHSTVSRRLKAMESDLGARLLDRKKSGYELTKEGEQLRKTAQSMEHHMLEMDAVLSGKDQQLQGKLTVSAINNMASTVLMPMFAEFSRLNPDIDLHINVSNKYVSLPERDADIAIRLTNSPSDTLIGKRMVTVASTVYGSKTYVDRLKKTKETPKWIGVECCEFHRCWTKEECEDKDHSFYVDDTILTRESLKQHLGLAYLPCFMGDTCNELSRYCAPNPKHNLGLWLLYHPDLKRTARVLAFKDYLAGAVNKQQKVFEGIIE